jgi:HSP20 family protein
MNDLFGRYGQTPAREYPALNVWTNEEGAVITAELPGVNAEDLDISLTGDTLTFRGSRAPEELEEGESYHRRERAYGDFVRSIRLPFGIDAGKVEASSRNGLLRLTLPRAEAEKPKKIEVVQGK